MNKIEYLLTLILLLMGCQNRTNEKSEDHKVTTDNHWEKIKSDSDSHQGFLDIYRDRKTGEVRLGIYKEHLNKDILHFRYIEDGSGLHYFRGMTMVDNVLEFRKDYNKIEVVGKNTNFYIEDGHSFKKGAASNISNPILASLDIEGESPDGSQYLISAKKLFLSEKLGPIKPVYDPQRDAKLLKMGSLDEEATKFVEVSTYPTNTLFSINYTFHNDQAQGEGSGSSLYEKRKITVKINHYLVEAPENNGFQARLADPRVGYFTSRKDNLSSKEKLNFHDYINKWNLIKKDPSATLSEPVKPIVWWIENTTPKQYRAYIKEGILLWNKAFEKAGFKNVIVVKEQPDDATWHANDLDYNVIRFASSPNAPFGGIGPSFVDPRTGEIIGSDIVLEYLYFTNRHRYAKLYDSGTLNKKALDSHLCMSGMLVSEGIKFGKLANAVGVDAIDEEQFMRDAIIHVAAHEVGHTLGLTHNMAASYAVSLQDLDSKEITGSKGSTASVMDYANVNIGSSLESQGHFFSSTLGEYDLWAIEFAYTPKIDSEKDYLAWRKKTLDRSSEPGLFYGNDADDMRAPGLGIDPRIMIGDLSSDPVSWAVGRMDLIDGIWSKLTEKYSDPHQSYFEYKHAFDTLVKQYSNAVRVISRFIGGIYNNRLMQGQQEEQLAFTPVPRKQQKEAMSYLIKYALDKDEWWPKDITARLQMQRRGFDFFGVPQDPNIQASILTIQNEVFNHVLNEVVLHRLSNATFYGNDYTALDALTDMRKGIFKSESKISLARRNLQSEFVKRLGKIIAKESSYDYDAQAASIYQIKEIEKFVTNSRNVSDGLTKAHLMKLQDDINLIWDKRKS